MQPRPRSLLVACLALCALFCLDQSAIRLRRPAAARPPGASSAETIDPAWLSRVQERIRRAEYQVTWQESTCLPGLERAYQAPNRAQGLRTYFTPDGFRMTSRTDPNAGWEWGLRLAAYGFAGAAGTPQAAALATDGNRIEYRRGNLTEWYVNDERGLEQGFTLAGAPARSTTADAPLVLDLALTGDLRPVAEANGGEIVLRDASGTPRVRYGQLIAFDATGRTLSSHMELAEAGTTVRLSVDAAGAAYPITVDPLSRSFGWSVQGDQAGSGFAAKVAGAGDINGDGYGDVIVGAGGYDIGFSNEGAAFVYLGSASGPSLTPHWTGQGLRDLANFGSAVGTAGDVNGDGYADIVVGAPGYNSLATGGGAVFVFHGSFIGLGPTGHPLNANWKWIGDVAGAHLGQSVGTAGDVNADGFSEIIVGTPYDKLSGVTRGSARVFWGSGNGLGWSPWVTYGFQPAGEFGAAVSTAGDVNGDGYADILIGAPNFDPYDTGEYLGGAFLFYGPDLPDGAGQWWYSYGTHHGADYGAAVSTAGDVNGDGYADVIVGAPGQNLGEVAEGAVHVFLGAAEGLIKYQSWYAEGDQVSANFGNAVGCAGDVNGDGYADIVVGADGYDNPEVNEGGVFVWFGSADGLGILGSPSNANWRYEGGTADQWVGYCVAAAGDVNGDGLSDVLVSSPHYADGLGHEGAAFLFYGTPSGMASGMEWGLSGGQTGARLGLAVGSADVWGFNRGNIIIGAPYFDQGQADEGVVWVFYSRTHGEMSATPDWTAEGNQTDAHFGAAVGGAGDVNGDGFEDLLIGAPGYSDGGTLNEGHVFVWHGWFTGPGDPGTPANADWSAEPNIQGAQFGSAVGTAGDVNGDGYSDIIVGVPAYDNPEVNEGGVFVWHGSASGLGANGTLANADWSAEMNRTDCAFGFSCGTAGDVNGDGYSDVIVGAPDYDVLVADVGRAFVWHGSASGLGAAGIPTNADWLASGNYGGGSFGYSVGTAGDVDGDGYSDVIVGAPYHLQTLAGVGRMSLYAGSATGLITGARVTRYGTQEGEHLGYVVGTAGDVNRDGLSDVFATSPDYDGPHSSTDGGKVAVWYGPETAEESSTPDAWVIAGAGTRLGLAAACAGDVNMDGYADLVIGAPYYDVDYTDEGRVFLWFGGGTRLNRAVGPAQDNVDIESPVARFNVTEEATQFCLGLQGFSPFGTGQAKLEHEIVPLGVPLDGSHVRRVGPWIDLEARGYGTGMRTVADGPASSNLHWRVRMRYNPATTPLLVAGPWMSVPSSAWSELKLRTPASPVGVEPAPVGGGQIALAPAAPNPFSSITVLRFSLPASAPVGLAVYDARGRRVRTLLRDQALEAGAHAFTWNGQDDAGRSVGPGVYFGKLSTNGFTTSTRLVRVHE